MLWRASGSEAATLDEYELVLRIVLAAALGGLIGFERELSDQPAGFRTHMLVSVGAALFTVAGAYGVEELFDGTATRVRFDPTRVAAQIVTGIGFLGAGAIIQQGFSVRGLTTAASLWVTAAVGLATGLGYYWGAAITAVFTVAALYLLKRMRTALFSRLKKGEARVAVRMGESLRLSQLVDVLELRGSRVESIKFADDDEGGKQLVAKLTLGPDVSPEEVVATASEVPGVQGIDWFR
ncbi:MAG TPA: MgtC/SapB family protein [Actinomycetota bacterium]|nr:MgtC/SapB family protein [Actinomycetota bacterium]